MGCAVSRTKREFPQTTLSKENLTTGDIVISPIFMGKSCADSFTDKYFIGDSVSSSGHSEVCLCIHKSTLSTRIAKVYYAKLHALTYGSFTALTEELNILLSLNHSNLISVSEYFVEQRTLTVVMDYCDGGDLLDQLTKKTKFTENLAAKIVKELLQAVIYLHESGIVHRNLTPEAVLFQSIGDDVTVRVAKFSYAESFAPRSHCNPRRGAVSFMSPELLNNNSSELCDEWSLGVLLYLMLSGVPPFEANSPTEIADKVNSGRYNLKKGVWPRVSPEGKELIRSLLVPERSRMAAKAALHHPWIQKFTDPKEPITPVPSESSENACKYHRVATLRTAAKHFVDMQRMLTMDIDRLKLAVAVRAVDGWMEIGEITSIARTLLFATLRKREVKKAIAAVAPDAEGRVRTVEVLEVLENSKTMFSKRKLKKALGMFGDQYSSEVIDALSVLDMSHPEVQSLLSKLD